ncbi:hypothetical protein NPIL_338961 [Nephila pilipes]|uniref:Uncharacterized protein n=1 Tax=Nephila pilipes TaxID=299642 RepID=A0A8X6MU13_NEPPI|nr:hypothetical protein NPIL_338961 [Nephila pilipes]
MSSNAGALTSRDCDILEKNKNPFLKPPRARLNGEKRMKYLVRSKRLHSAPTMEPQNHLVSGPQLQLKTDEKETKRPSSRQNLLGWDILQAIRNS